MAAQAPHYPGPRATFPRHHGPLHLPASCSSPAPGTARLRGAAGLRDLISGRPAPGTREQLTPDPQQPPAPGHRGQRLAFIVRLLGDNMLPFARKINLKSEIRRKDVTFRTSSFVATSGFQGPQTSQTWTRTLRTHIYLCKGLFLTPDKENGHKFKLVNDTTSPSWSSLISSIIMARGISQCHAIKPVFT